MTKKQKEDYASKLKESFDRWQFLYEHGGNDPGGSDGANLNLVRNHIFYYKQQIKETMKTESYPDIYYRAAPPEVENDYMARPDEIRNRARDSLALYLADKDYQFLVGHVDRIHPRDEKTLFVRNLIYYAEGLALAILEDDLVTMRRHRETERYLSSLRSRAEAVRKLKPPENEQINLFSVYDYEEEMDDEETDDEKLEM